MLNTSFLLILLLKTSNCQIVEDAVYVYKGTNSDLDSYSAFWDNSYAQRTRITSELVQRDVNELYLTGLAYDVCVGQCCRRITYQKYSFVW